MKIYTYFSAHRPVGPGSYPKPKGNFPAEIKNYDDKTFVESIGREAWGEIDYLSPLSPEDLEAYELIPAPDETERK